MAKAEAVQQPTESEILAILKDAKSEVHTEQLALRLGIARHTAAKYLEILQAKGQVSCRKVGNAKLWREASSRVIIRPLTSDDLAPVLSIQRAAQTQVGSAKLQPAEAESALKNFQQMVEYHLEWSDPAWKLGAEVQGQLVGFILGEIRLWEHGGEEQMGWIKTLAVDPQYQGRGVGCQLAEELLAQFRSRGVRRVRTMIDWQAGRLFAYFHALGFSILNMLPLEKEFVEPVDEEIKTTKNVRALLAQATLPEGVEMNEKSSVVEAACDAFTEIHPPLADRQAVIEATRCLECGGPYAPAPCTVACPTHIDIPKFIREIREGRPLDSARTIFEANVLGGSCARVCPVEVLCQGACVLTKEGRRAVEIGRLQRYATDWAFARHEPVMPSKARSKRKQRVAVLGAGPAGLACAAELARLGYPVTLYENKTMPGGLVSHAIAPYKQLVEPLPHEVEQIQKLGVGFQFGVTVGRDVSMKELEEDYAAIFLGIGLGEDQPADVPGEDLEGVYESLDFVEQLKLGDWRQLQRHLGVRVAVIGGGNTAIDMAREVVRLGAKEVTVIYRRTEKDMPAYAHEYEAARREGVRFLWLTAPTRFLGSGRIHAVECVHLRMIHPEAGRRSPLELIPGTEFVLEVDGVIKAIGQQRRTSFVEQIQVLELERGLIKVNEWGQAGTGKYFAGGDCVNGGDTAVRAVAEGRRAAQGIHRYLSGEAS